MRLAQRRRHDQVAEQRPGRVLSAVAEGRLRRPVELDDPPLVVHRDHAVEGRLQHGSAQGLALAHRLLGAPPLHLLADLAPDAARDRHQRGVRPALRGREELHHSAHALRSDDRERERAVEPGGRRRARSRQPVVGADLVDPFRLAALPHDSRQPHARDELERPPEVVELLERGCGRQPGRHASKGSAPWVISHSAPACHPRRSPIASSSRGVASSSVGLSASAFATERSSALPSSARSRIGGDAHGGQRDRGHHHSLQDMLEVAEDAVDQPGRDRERDRIERDDEGLEAARAHRRDERRHRQQGDQRDDLVGGRGVEHEYGCRGREPGRKPARAPPPDLSPHAHTRHRCTLALPSSMHAGVFGDGCCAFRRY